MVTDRDIAVKVVADGRDPGSVKVGELAEGKPVTIGADDSVEEALRTMTSHGVRRLPVIDGHDLVGVVSQADIARNLPEDKVGDLVEAISKAPANG
jgi:CBS domain-containing protein